MRARTKSVQATVRGCYEMKFKSQTDSLQSRRIWGGERKPRTEVSQNTWPRVWELAPDILQNQNNGQS